MTTTDQPTVPRPDSRPRHIKDVLSDWWAASCPGCGARCGLPCEPCFRAQQKFLTFGDPPAETGPTDPNWQRFRRNIIRQLRGFTYIDSDRVVGDCPVCRTGPPEFLTVRFHGRAERADLECSLGCAEAAIADALGVEVLR